MWRFCHSAYVVEQNKYKRSELEAALRSELEAALRSELEAALALHKPDVICITEFTPKHCLL